MSAALVRGVTLLALIASAGCAAPPPPSPLQGATPSIVPPTAPPGTLPCNWQSDAGGEGVTHHLHYLDDKPGLVKIDYNNFVKPDDIKVMYRGREIAGTGRPRSGRGGFLFDWNPATGDYVVDVVVKGEMWGTRWRYSITCPAAPSS
jgi:hypothetical protein